MSAYHKELCERLIRDGVQPTAAWFIEMVANQRIRSCDFSELERKFWQDIEKHYQKWCRERLN
jgi:hypothetical protein